MIFAQVYSLSKGLKRFGDKGKAAAYLEMKQLHHRLCWKPTHIEGLSESDRRKAMESLIFLTEKRDGRIKARTVADGSKQRLWMTILRAVVDSAGAVLAKVFVASVCGLTKAAVAAELADDVKAETCVGTSMMVK